MEFEIWIEEKMDLWIWNERDKWGIDKRRKWMKDRMDMCMGKIIFIPLQRYYK